MKRRAQKFLIGMMVFLCFLRGGEVFSRPAENVPQLEINISLRVYEDGRVPKDHEKQSIRWLVNWLEEKDVTGQQKLLTVGKHIKAVTICLAYDGDYDWSLQDVSLKGHHYLTPILQDLERLRKWIPIKLSFGQTSTDNFAHIRMRRAWNMVDNSVDSTEYFSRLSMWKEKLLKTMTLENLLTQPEHNFLFSGTDILLPQVGPTGGGQLGKNQRWGTLNYAWSLLTDPERVRESESAFYAGLGLSLQQFLAKIYADKRGLPWLDSFALFMFDITDLNAFFTRQGLNESDRENIQTSTLQILEQVKAGLSFTYCWENWNDWDPQWRGLPEKLISLMALTSYPAGGINFVLPFTATPENCCEYFERFKRCVSRMKEVKRVFNLPKDRNRLSSSDKWCPTAEGSPSSWAISLPCPAKQGLAWGGKSSLDIPLLEGGFTRFALRPLSKKTVERAIKFAKKEGCGLNLIFPTTTLAENYLGMDFQENLIKWVAEEFSKQGPPEEKKDPRSGEAETEKKNLWGHEGSNCFNVPGLRERQTFILTR